MAPYEDLEKTIQYSDVTFRHFCFCMAQCLRSGIYEALVLWMHHQENMCLKRSSHSLHEEAPCTPEAITSKPFGFTNHRPPPSPRPSNSPVFPRHIIPGFRKKIKYVHQRYDALLEEIITRRETKRRNEKISHDGKEEDRLNDFLDLLLDAMEDEKTEIQLTREHIKALILDFFTAGTDTSATALDWATAELINNPKIMEKARKEIDEAVGENKIVDESDSHRLPYIQAIIKETLRLHPPIPMLSRKATEDCFVRGYKIPEKTLLFVNIWAIARDPRYWEKPLEFSPERFLSEKESVRDVKGHHFDLLPFGTGRRGCPGMSLAMLELNTSLAAMIQCFDFKVVGPNGESLDGGDHVLICRNGPG